MSAEDEQLVHESAGVEPGEANTESVLFTAVARLLRRVEDLERPSVISFPPQASVASGAANVTYTVTSGGAVTAAPESPVPEV